MSPLLRRIVSRDGLAVLALVLVLGYFVQPVSSNESSQLALVMAIAHGTSTVNAVPRVVDPTFGKTQDLAFSHNHYYSDKAPGLAFVALPAYGALRTVGLDFQPNPRRFVWALGLWAALLPALLVLLLVRRVADALVPGTGTATALTLALGTMLLPFSDLLFSHALSALLLFGAFAIVFSERRTGPRPARLLVAGLLAGYAVTTEYPNALGVAILGAYALSRRADLGRRAAAYMGGALLGFAPLLAYDQWAFHSPFRYSRSLVVLRLPQNNGYHGIGGVDTPSLLRLWDILFHGWTGLLVQSPVLVAAAAGLVLLYRRGWRAEALTCGALVLAFVVYLSGFIDPFGAASPGVRYVVPILPFLALGLAAAFRAAPRVTSALAVVSIATMTLVTSTGPGLVHGSPGSPLTRLRHELFSAAAFNPIGHEHPLANVLPYFVLVAVLAVLLVRSVATRR